MPSPKSPRQPSYNSRAALSDGWVEIPPELPKEASSVADKVRVALLENPGKAAALDQRFTSRKLAERHATNFGRSRPSRLLSTAGGKFRARAFKELTGRWGVVVWYEEG